MSRRSVGRAIGLVLAWLVATISIDVAAERRAPACRCPCTSSVPERDCRCVEWNVVLLKRDGTPSSFVISEPTREAALRELDEWRRLRMGTGLLIDGSRYEGPCCNVSSYCPSRTGGSEPAPSTDVRFERPAAESGVETSLATTSASTTRALLDVAISPARRALLAESRTRLLDALPGAVRDTLQAPLSRSILGLWDAWRRARSLSDRVDVTAELRADLLNEISSIADATATAHEGLASTLDQLIAAGHAREVRRFEAALADARRASDDAADEAIERRSSDYERSRSRRRSTAVGHDDRCSDMTSRIRTETRRPSGADSCDGEMTVFLTNTSAIDVDCTYCVVDADDTPGSCSSVTVRAGRRKGGASAGMYSCGVGPHARIELRCAARGSPGECSEHD